MNAQSGSKKEKIQPPSGNSNPQIRKWQRKFPFNISPEIRWQALGLAFISFFIAFFAMVGLDTARIPYFALSPGNVLSVQQAIQIDSSTNHPIYHEDAGGNFGYVTARVSSSLSPLEWINHQLNSDTRVIHNKELGEDAPAPEVRREIARQEIRNSQATATLLALDILNIDVPIVNLGLRIREVHECVPAYQTLRAEDIILELDGISTLSSSALSEELAKKEAGQIIVMTLDRSGSIIEDVEVELSSRNNPCLSDSFEDTADNGPALGIIITEILEYQPPVDVNFGTGNIGGSSAGLAFALGVLDLLEPGDLTGGRKVVATGAISRNGEVSAIGGLPEKLISAERRGYSVFFVPASQLSEIEGKNKDVQIIGVATIYDALDYLSQTGGDPVDLPEAGL